MVDLEWEITEHVDPKNDNNLAKFATYEKNLESEELVHNDLPDTIDTARRVHRPPIWMNDYMSHVNLFEKEAQTHLTLFIKLDPITYAHWLCKVTNERKQWMQKLL